MAAIMLVVVTATLTVRHADAYEASPRVVMPHYAQLTLGIEKDHLSDEDFTPGDEGAVLDDHKTLKTRKQSGKLYYIRHINKRKEGRLGKLDDLREHAKLRKVETGEKVENVETDRKMENVDNDEEVDSDKKVESAESGEIVESVEASKNVESGHSVEESECGEKRDREVEKQASKSKVESVKSAENVENTDTVESVGSTEYLEGVDTMANSEGYFDGNHANEIPASFRWSYRIFRCTHGVSQNSRSTGQRNRKARYCGCLARFTPTVMKVHDGTYHIFIRNEVCQSLIQANYRLPERPDW
ncbi:hypothetical protein F442_09362 [Phytophthora nicotianae P10297]|uniref:RxLR effector protein n=1 Tax=Phytophthora nicotianae P10297 TaxID=1317064 RepID=W2ZAB6_PHYNI|nr:hypothetical protein F442_09362 [Phytophthora nicotianae P10297]